MLLRQDSNSGRDNRAEMRTQSPHEGDVNVQRPDRPTSLRVSGSTTSGSATAATTRTAAGGSIVYESGRGKEQERGSSRYD